MFTYTYCRHFCLIDNSWNSVFIHVLIFNCNRNNTNGITATCKLRHDPLHSILREDTDEFQVWSSFDIWFDERTEISFYDTSWKSFDNIICFLKSLPYVFPITNITRWNLELTESSRVCFLSLPDKLLVWKSPHRSFKTFPNCVTSSITTSIQNMWLTFMLTWDQVFGPPFRFRDLCWIENRVLIIIIIVFFFKPIEKWKAVSHS